MSERTYTITAEFTITNDDLSESSIKLFDRLESYDLGVCTDLKNVTIEKHEQIIQGKTKSVIESYISSLKHEYILKDFDDKEEKE